MSNNAPKLTDKQTKNGRNISGVTTIHTLDDLLAYFEVDTKVWEVKTFECNKWEMGYIREKNTHGTKTPAERNDNTSPATRTPGHEDSKTTYEADRLPLYQVKAVLGRIFTVAETNVFVDDNTKLQRETKRLSIQLAAERRYRNTANGNIAPLEVAVEGLRELALQLGEFNLTRSSILHQRPAVPVHAVSGGHTEDAVLLLSDTHFGDVIRPDDTSGFPSFDLTIAGNRFGYVIGKAKQILTLHRAMYPIKRLYVWIGGDIGNGDLHDSPSSNALFIAPQVDFSFKMFKNALEDLATLTEPDEAGNVVVEEIIVLVTCGNHMRESLCKFMPMKYQAQRTFDWLIYQMLITWFTGKKNFTVRQEMSPYIFENIRGHRHLFAHGMQVGYKNSPDNQAKSMDAFLKTVRSLFDSPEFRRKNGLEGATFARACIGDIHVPVKFPRLVSNGSLNGQNELGVNWGLEPIPAGQQLFGVTESHLETFGYFIECSQVQKEVTDFNTYGEFAQEYEARFGRK